MSALVLPTVAIGPPPLPPPKQAAYKIGQEREDLMQYRLPPKPKRVRYKHPKFGKPARGEDLAKAIWRYLRRKDES
ncbi:unnamed protein product [Penicillium camemberti]|uniref:Str. FM013 n=1 Tax=Penicillium camemberti (strain FM 013) TaxID=1429867 RepID=A0A0G4PD73_PENC3|nr:unnamed protein product [Penicillium camemberti]